MKEGNKVIARFMGVDVSNGWNPTQPCIPNYRMDWNLLMPVVEKIDKLYDAAFPGNEEFIRRILLKEEPLDGPYMDVVALPLATPIDEVYKAVLSFIEWYNNQKQP